MYNVFHKSDLFFIHSYIVYRHTNVSMIEYCIISHKSIIYLSVIMCFNNIENNLFRVEDEDLRPTLTIINNYN